MDQSNNEEYIETYMTDSTADPKLIGHYDQTKLAGIPPSSDTITISDGALDIRPGDYIEDAFKKLLDKVEELEARVAELEADKILLEEDHE